MHIGIIPDGNRRWARQHGLKPWEGHTHGFHTLLTLLTTLPEEVTHLTFYALSTENLEHRSTTELTALFRLLTHALTNLSHILHEKGVSREDLRVTFHGARNRLPQHVQHAMSQVERENPTEEEARLTLRILLAYNGQDEIVHAARQLITQNIPAEEVTRERFARELWIPPHPPLDIIIRTGMTDGQRLSGFMLWHSSYAEFYFLKTYWPDFTSEDLQRIITDFKTQRNRRYGK